jgi:hypothetical protein
VGVTFWSEIGEVTITERQARELVDDLRRMEDKFGRAPTAADAIEAALVSGAHVVLEHAHRLAVLDVLRKRPSPLPDELALLDAALAAASSLTRGTAQMGRTPRLAAAAPGRRGLGRTGRDRGRGAPIRVHAARVRPV